MPYDQNYQSISDCREFWFKGFIIGPTHVGPTFARFNARIPAAS